MKNGIELFKATPKCVLNLIFLLLNNRDSTAFALSCRDALWLCKDYLYKILNTTRPRAYESPPQLVSLMIPVFKQAPKDILHCQLTSNQHLLGYPNGIVALFNHKKLLAQISLCTSAIIRIRELSNQQFIVITVDHEIALCQIGAKNKLSCLNRARWNGDSEVISIEEIPSRTSRQKKQQLMVATRTGNITIFNLPDLQPMSWELDNLGQADCFSLTSCGDQIVVQIKENQDQNINLWGVFVCSNGNFLIKVAQNFPKKGCKLLIDLILDLSSLKVRVLQVANEKSSVYAIHPSQVICLNRWAASVGFYKPIVGEFIEYQNYQTHEQACYHAPIENKRLPVTTPSLQSDGNLSFFSHKTFMGKQELVIANFPLLN